MNREEYRKPPRAKPVFFHGYVVVIAAFCIVVVSYGAQSAYGVFFQPVLTDFGWSRSTISGAFSLSMIFSGLSAVVMGKLTDSFGPRLIITICGLLIGLGYLLMSHVSTAWHVYLFYGVIIGSGMGGIFVTLLSTIAGWFDKKRSMMTGIVLTGTGTGTLAMPALANRLIYSFGWHTSYIVFGTILLVVIISAGQFIKHNPDKTKKLPSTKRHEIEQEFKSTYFGFSIRQAVYTRQFWQVFAMCICSAFIMFAVIVHIVAHAIDLGASAISAANILVAVGIADIAGRVVMGIAADRIGNKYAFIIGFALISLALFGLGVAKEVWMLYLFAIIYGFAYSDMGTSISPLLARLFGLRSHGLIYGLVSVGTSIGSSIGPLFAGYMFDISGNYDSAFLACASIALVGLVLTVLLKPIREELVPKEVLNRL